MVSAPKRNESESLAALETSYAAIVGEARAEVTEGRAPAVDEFANRIRAATEREIGSMRGPAIEGAESKALQQLTGIAAVFRARELLTRAPEPAPTPRAAPPTRKLLRSRPTISANMNIRRGADGDRLTLSWDAVPAVVEWEVRFSERPDPRGSYLLLDSVILPSTETAVDVPVGEHAFRVNILGRSRDGRPLRRALISSLTRETWNDRWERRASAA